MKIILLPKKIVEKNFILVKMKIKNKYNFFKKLKILKIKFKNRFYRLNYKLINKIKVLKFKV